MNQQAGNEEFPEYSGWSLFKEGKIPEAIDAYGRGLAKRKAVATYNNRALAYWSIGEYDRAIEDLKLSDELSLKRFGRADFNLNKIGAITWIRGDHLKAAKIWQEIIWMHTRKEFSGGDAAGDVGCGLLLWFASCFEETAEFRNDAETYLRKKAKLKSSRSFPGPLSRYILKIETEATILEAAKYPVPSQGYCMAYFYIAAMKRGVINDESYRHLLKKSVEYGSQRMLETEYYLAHHLLSSHK